MVSSKENKNKERIFSEILIVDIWPSNFGRLSHLNKTHVYPLIPNSSEWSLSPTDKGDILHPSLEACLQALAVHHVATPTQEQGLQTSARQGPGV